MIYEWLLVFALLVAAVVLMVGRRSPVAVRLGALLGCVVSLASMWLWQQHLDGRMRSLAELNPPHAERPGGYLGSTACRACHPDQYTSWHQSYHRTMTQPPTPETVRGNFNNVRLELDGSVYQLERRGEEFWVEMDDPSQILEHASKIEEYLQGRVASPPPPLTGAPRVQRRICLMTGSHSMQAYWMSGQHGNKEESFPFIYVFEQERWVPRRSVFMKDPTAVKWEQVWNVGCIDCHATAGQPRVNPVEQTFKTRVGELGIACEACHGPGEEHVRLNSDPRRRYILHAQKQPDSSIVNPARLPTKRASEVCGRCHGISSALDTTDWNENGLPYLPGQVLESQMHLITLPKSVEFRRHFFWNDGMVRVSGRELNGVVKSPCYLKGDLSCLSCHSLHSSSPTNQLSSGMESNRACLQCHKQFEKNLEAHTHHPATSSGSLCYNCHMPYTTYGLLKALRSHQINNPTVKASVQTGRPNACNLCHLDKTLDWTSQTLSAWYKTPPEDLSPEEKKVAASVLWAVKGDSGQRALIAWHMGWKPAREASDDSWFAPYLASMLDDPYAVVRYIAGRSLKRLPGFQNFSYDYIGPPAEQQEARRRVLGLWEQQAKAVARPGLLLGKDGRLAQEQFESLLESRNNRLLELFE
jgi:predicted CXXCH cytochrome family protein